MKRLFLIISTILTLTACSNEGASQKSHSRPISFNNVSTRADIDDIEAAGFGVWAGMKANDETTYTPILENEQVYLSGGEWTYDNTRYWFDNCDFSFIACYPRKDDYYTFNAENCSIEFSVAETPSETDFLVATNVTDTSFEGFNPANPVSLTFSHALTQVALQIWRDGAKHTNDEMRIKKVTLSNLAKAGTYSSATGVWSTTNEKLNLSYEKTEFTNADNIGAAIVMDNGTLDTGGIAANPWGDMLLIPQTLENVALRITYELKRNNAADWEEAELEAALPPVTWTMSNRYTYNVVLSSVTDITIYYIQTKVDPWGTPQVGGTVIIK